ncbi:unnamed protein product [Onchocerca flexuosa]|uniref:ASMase_C domain-containing protein n=1 Tax=Onchocerca flexuosa TaxID=387005 RepID=A0A183HLU4_9BILA|nr:unnamed protein product [Onchocerca flexuosa]
MNDDSSEPINILYASPSVTTFTYLNPAFRIYEVEPGKNYRVVNFHTYFLNLTRTNEMNATSPTWELLYSAKEEYGLKDLSPKSWDHLINEITYQKTTYDKFIKNSLRRDDFICEEKCRYNTLCFLRKGHHNATLCSHLTPHSSIKRNPYNSSGIADKIGGMMDMVDPATVAEQQQQYAEIMMLLKKKLRSYIMKRFLQLFLFP